MSDYVSPEKLGLFLYFFAPGLILIYFRSTFLTGKMPSGADAVLAFVTVSVVYQAALLPFTNLKIEELKRGELPTLWWAILIFVLPAILGAFFGLNARHQWLRDLLRRIQMNTVHPVDTAWDFRFGHCKESYVLVTLKNGTKWAGLLGSNSFLSTSPAERDLYIEAVYHWKNADVWRPAESGVWIAGSEIQTI